MVQWVKNPAVVGQVAVGVQVQSLAQHSGLRHPALPEDPQVAAAAWIQSLAWELPYVVGAGKKKKKPIKETGKVYQICNKRKQSEQ